MNSERNFTSEKSHKIRLALIEDHEIVRDSFESLLTAAGHDVVAFDTAESFLNTDDLDFDCMVIDLGLPGMDGFSLIQKLHDDGTANSRMILISGNHNSELEARISEFRDVFMLDKPSKPQLLLETIEREI